MPVKGDVRKFKIISKELADIQDHLEKTVSILSKEIGSRGYLQIDALNKTADYIKSEFSRYGYTVFEQSYKVEEHTYRNIFVEIKGIKSPEKTLIVGAHYDTVIGTPGADDNASGIAGLLGLARLLRDRPFDKTIQLVAFTLEEPPFFRTRFMGSYVYAKHLRQQGIDVEGMICLEMIGYFTDEADSQFYPLPFFRWLYPTTGNFITIVSNMRSRNFLNQVKSAFKKNMDLPVVSLSALPLVLGIDFSDHRSFWKFGYKAVMVTDTAFYRNPQYHGTGDVADILDYGRMAKVVSGLVSVIEELSKKESTENRD